jgi:hypothetical protein
MKKEALLQIEKFSPEEQDVILSLVVGSDFRRLGTGCAAITSSG